MRIRGLVAVLAVAGCGSPPCSTECPAVGGTYSMTYSRTSASTVSFCPAPLTLPATLTFTQSKADLTTTVGMVSLRGQVSANGDFTLSGEDDSRGAFVVTFSGKLTGPGLVHGVLSENMSSDPQQQSNGGRTEAFADCSVDTVFDGVRPL
ncbi:MAG: hypothetical protein QM723_27955 [Myxococcaceae bacterium]